MLYTDEAVYFGVVAFDGDPARVIVTDLKKDYVVDASDAFAVILDTFHDGRNGYEFATNPSGAKYDAQVTNEGTRNQRRLGCRLGGEDRRTAIGWVAEMRIPFRTLRFASADPQTWGVNFRRKVRRLNEDSYWSRMPRIWGLERVSLAGTVTGLQGLQAGKNLRVKPYVVSSGSTVRSGPTNGEFSGGVDVKYGVTNGLVWDFTVNTDFSQVEADEQQVNLTRFSLFFPEKREFFLENSGVFGFGLPDASNLGSAFAGSIAFGGRQNGTPDMRLFFSRRIGLSGRRRRAPDSRRHAAHRTRGRVFDRSAEHSTARGSGRIGDQLYGPASEAECPGQFRDRGRAAQQGAGQRVQPHGGRRCEFPLRIPAGQRFPCANDVAGSRRRHDR
jgi:hypothetical protein